MALQKAVKAEAGFGVAHWLCLAASPTFAVMAIVTYVSSPMLCSVMSTLPLDGMVLMYLLMSVFHAAPWVRLVYSRRNRTLVQA